MPETVVPGNLYGKKLKGKMREKRREKLKEKQREKLKEKQV